MKSKLILTGLLLVTLIVSFSSFAAEESQPSMDLPLLTTSAGQSPEIDTLNLLVGRAEIKFDYCDAPTVELIKEGVGLGGAEPGKDTTYNYITIGTDTEKFPEGTSYKTVMFSIGASLKGMGASGLSVNSEISRVENILTYAEENDISIVAVHIGGSARRGEPGSANERMIDTVAPGSDYLIVTGSGNDDGKFTEIAEENEIALKEIGSPLDLVPVLKDLFGVSE
jgi:hypothetical protein